jgi:hypothetical protein
MRELTATFVIALISVLAMVSGCGEPSNAVLGGTDAQDAADKRGSAFGADQLDLGGGGDLGGATAPAQPSAFGGFPTRFTVATHTSYPESLEHDAALDLVYDENYVVLTANFRNADEDEVLRLGILEGSGMDLRVRDDGSVTVTHLLIRFQDIVFPRSSTLPTGMYLGNLTLQAPERLTGRVVGYTGDHLDIELGLDVDLTVDIGTDKARLAPIPPVEVRDFPLVVSLERDPKDGRISMRATAVKGDPLLSIDNFLTIREAWIDMAGSVIADGGSSR